MHLAVLLPIKATAAVGLFPRRGSHSGTASDGSTRRLSAWIRAVERPKPLLPPTTFTGTKASATVREACVALRVRRASFLPVGSSPLPSSFRFRKAAY